ncbi:MAG: cation diffusion facilitator family transporter [Thermoprotei archaeon]
MHIMIMRNREKALKAALTAGLLSMIFAVIEPLVMIIMGHSSIIFADAMHSFLDAAMSFATALSIYITSKKRFSSKFPWGLYKIENLASLFIVFVTIYFVIMIIIQTVSNLSKTPLYALPLLLIGASTSYSMYKYEIKWAKRSRSSSLLTDALHAKTDAYITLAAFIGILAEIITNILALQLVILSMIILYTIMDIVRILKDSLLSLLDAAPPKEKVIDIIRTVEEISGAKVAKTMLKRAGSFIMGTIILETDTLITLRDAHKIVMKTKKKLYSKYSEITNLIIAIKPLNKYKNENYMMT